MKSWKIRINFVNRSTKIIFFKGEESQIKPWGLDRENWFAGRVSSYRRWPRGVPCPATLSVENKLHSRRWVSHCRNSVVSSVRSAVRALAPPLAVEPLPDEIGRYVNFFLKLILTDFNGLRNPSLLKPIWPLLKPIHNPNRHFFRQFSK